jgi:hypothetical protein
MFLVYFVDKDDDSIDEVLIRIDELTPAAMAKAQEEVNGVLGDPIVDMVYELEQVPGYGYSYGPAPLRPFTG